MASVPSPPPDTIPPNILFLVGPILIGNLVSWLLLGVLSMQLYVYHICFPNDRWWIKFTAYGLYLVDIVQTACVTDSAWTTLCEGWGKPSALIITDWSFSMTPVVNSLICGWVQIFFAWRVWALGRSHFWALVTALIVAIALTQAGAAIAAGVKFAHINNLKEIHELNALVSVWLAGSVIADVLIAASMVYFLTSASRKSMWGKASNKRITKLIRSTVETGVMSAAAAALDLALYLGFKHNNLHIAVAMMLSKLYSNALMASLNSRSGVYERSLPSSSRDGTYGNGNTGQFTSVGIAVTTDDSMSLSGTAVQDGFSNKEREELTKTGHPHEGIALSDRSAFYYAKTVG